MTKKELEKELKALVKASEYILEEWLEHDNEWPVFVRFEKAIKRAKEAIKKS